MSIFLNINSEKAYNGNEEVNNLFNEMGLQITVVTNF